MYTGGTNSSKLRVLLVALNVFLLLLTIIFIILFATKSTKATALLVSFQGNYASSSKAAAEIKQAFKDAKYNVKDVSVQEAADNTYRGIVLLKGNQDADKVRGKVSASTGSFSNLVLGSGSSAADVCYSQLPQPPKTTTTAAATATSTSAPTTTAQKPVITSWCPSSLPRDYILVVDTLCPATGPGKLKLDTYGPVIRDFLKNKPVGSRVSMIGVNDHAATQFSDLTDDILVLGEAYTKLNATFLSANSSSDQNTLFLDDAAFTINHLPHLDSNRPISVILIVDHTTGTNLEFAKLRTKGVFVNGVFVNAAPIPDSILSSTGVQMDGFHLSNDGLKQALCLAKKFACLTHDVVFVFDETQSIYNDTIDGWKNLAKKFIDEFRMSGEVPPDDVDKGVFTRFSVVVFGGLENKAGGVQRPSELKSDDTDYASYILFDLDTCTSTDEAKQRISDHVFVYNGLTNITSALTAVQRVLDSAHNYDADPAYNRTEKRIVIMMTDGFLTADEQSHTIAQAKVLREAYKADLWFVLAEDNAQNVDFPGAYQFAVTMTNNIPQRVFNSSAKAITNDVFANTYQLEYPCPPERCKVVYIACENSEVLDPLVFGHSNQLCVQEAIRLADEMHAVESNITFRFLLYSNKDLTTLIPAQGEDDSYENFRKEILKYNNSAKMDEKHGGFTFLANALNVVSNSFTLYARRKPLVNGALYIAGQFMEGKIEDYTSVKAAANTLKSKIGENIFVLDRSDMKHAPTNCKTKQFGWCVVTSDEQINVFNGTYEVDRAHLQQAGFFAKISNMSCERPPFFICQKTMYDVQFVLHLADADAKSLQQKDVAAQFIKNFKAPYPIHIGANFLGQPADKPSLDLAIGSTDPSKIISLIENNMTSTDLQDLSIWDDVVAKLVVGKYGCGYTTNTGDRVNVDNTVVVVSNDWSKWAKTAWTAVAGKMKAWMCADCANFPKFYFLDLNAKSTPADLPTGLQESGQYTQVPSYDFERREPITALNTAVNNICSKITRACCMDFECSKFDGKACARPTFQQVALRTR